MFVLAAMSQSGLGQPGNDPLQLQKSGIAKIDHWMDYARRTGDAKSTLGELGEAQLELKASYDIFQKQQNFAGASWSAIKVGDIQRLENQWRQAVPIYQTAIELAQRANRTDYQTKALARLAYSELKIGDTSPAADHIREAVRLGANCGNKDFYFEALDVAGEIEVKLGNLVAAGEYLDRALAMSGQIDDKRQLYLGYADRGDIYYQRSFKCELDRAFDVCYQLLDLSRADYQRALGLTRELGYEFFSGLFQEMLKVLDVRKEVIQKTQSGDQGLEDAMFSPQKAKDVLVTERFATSGMDANNLAIATGTTNQLQDWLAQKCNDRV
jgi:tetratricopeptide (TPR) repeat protein